MTFLEKEKHPRAMENLVQFETAGKLKQVDSIKELAENIVSLVPAAANTYPYILNRAVLQSIATRCRINNALAHHHFCRIAFKCNVLLVLSCACVVFV
jgi:hypothetical protein